MQITLPLASQAREDKSLPRAALCRFFRAAVSTERAVLSERAPLRSGAGEPRPSQIDYRAESLAPRPTADVPSLGAPRPHGRRRVTRGQGAVRAAAAEDSGSHRPHRRDHSSADGRYSEHVRIDAASDCRMRGGDKRKANRNVCSGQTRQVPKHPRGILLTKRVYRSRPLR